ncbi:unnamed protein product, partial [Meganyctiphanes norvegica]
NPLLLTCDTDGSTLTWTNCHDCHDSNNATRFNMMIQNCRYLCDTTLREFTFCFNDGDTQTCNDLGIGQQAQLNASMLSIREGSMCSHIAYNGLNHQSITCPRECPMECHVSGMPDCSENYNAPSSIFWTYLFFRLAAIFFMSSSFTMLEAVVLATVKQHKGQYGKQRILATLGQSIIPLLSGGLITAFSSGS